MFISGALENTAIQNTTETLLIPASAVLWTGESSVVYVKDTQQAVFEMREVKLGKRLGDSYEVLSGLKTGEQIVTNGTFTVDAAAQLQGKKSMMNKSGGKTMTGHEGHGMTNDQDMAKMELSSEFQSKFKKVLTTYLELKDQFVSSEPAQIAKSANATLTALNQLTNVDVSPEVQSHLTEIKTLLEAIGKQQDLEGQRMHFVPLNEHLVHLVTNLNNLDNTIYVQRCPMANNNQGAIWLSAEQEIRNPYFGDAMLKCGSVVETLQN
jgi:Cu(I)/Ag(I) efflux system membrane fusion protein